MAANKEAAQFKRAFNSMPLCMVGAPMGGERTLFDLVQCCRIQLDLIESGEDGTEEDDPRAIRRWLKRWEKKLPV